MLTIPPLTPVTTPPEDTVAIEVLPLTHVPPDVASVKVMLLPVVTVVGPEMADGTGYTVNEWVT